MRLMFGASAVLMLLTVCILALLPPTSSSSLSCLLVAYHTTPIGNLLLLHTVSLVLDDFPKLNNAQPKRARAAIAAALEL
jgi:hypothetical protein